MNLQLLKHFTYAYLRSFGEFEIGPSKILTNEICFAEFIKVFPCQNFALYGSSVQ